MFGSVGLNESSSFLVCTKHYSSAELDQLVSGSVDGPDLLKAHFRRPVEASPVNTALLLNRFKRSN